MRNLEIGDKVYNTKQDGFNDFTRYTFSKVVTLTKTLAVLSNGVRLINKPKPSYITEDIGYSEYRNKGSHWHLVSLQAIRKAQVENEKKAATNWFDNKQFTLQEKQWIYNKFIGFEREAKKKMNNTVETADYAPIEE